MPLDTRRLPVPEESKSPFALVKKSDDTNVKLLNDQEERADGRKCHQVRPVFLKVGVVSQAKGSAYIEMDKTKVICSVYGPREVTKREEFSMKGQLNCDFKYATFSRRFRCQHQSDNQEKDYSLVLQQALEPAICMDKFPKARMDVFVKVLEDDGGVLAAAITCASVAMADGGIEMYDLVVGCSLRQYGSTSLLDPCGLEKYTLKLGENLDNNGSITVGFMPSIQQVSALVQNGQLDINVAQDSIKLCVATCQRMYPVVQQCLVKAVKQRLKGDQT